MNHPDQIILQSYVDGELGDSQQAEVEEHVAGCPQCQQAIESMDTLGRILRASQPEVDVFCCATDFMGRLRMTLSQHGKSPWALVVFLPPLLLVALAAAVQLTMFIALWVISLGKLKLMPSVKSMLAKPVDLMFDTRLIGTIVERGWIDQTMGQEMLGWWDQQGDPLWFVPIIVGSAFILGAALLGFGFLWFRCWKMSRVSHGQGGQ